MSLDIEKKILIKVKKNQVPDDVLERVADYEDFEDEFGNLIYRISTFKKILSNKEDNTNETTKYRIEEFVKQIGKADYVMIVV